MLSRPERTLLGVTILVITLGVYAAAALDGSPAGLGDLLRYSDAPLVRTVLRLLRGSWLVVGAILLAALFWAGPSAVYVSASVWAGIGTAMAISWWLVRDATLVPGLVILLLGFVVWRLRASAETLIGEERDV